MAAECASTLCVLSRRCATSLTSLAVACVPHGCHPNIPCPGQPVGCVSVCCANVIRKPRAPNLLLASPHFSSSLLLSLLLLCFAAAAGCSRSLAALGSIRAARLLSEGVKLAGRRHWSGPFAHKEGLLARGRVRVRKDSCAREDRPHDASLMRYPPRPAPPHPNPLNTRPTPPHSPRHPPASPQEGECRACSGRAHQPGLLPRGRALVEPLDDLGHTRLRGGRGAGARGVQEEARGAKGCQGVPRGAKGGRGEARWRAPR
jgi:hypothetical protein